MRTQLITFSGLDGAGKTTQIKMLQSHLEDTGRLFNTAAMYDDVSLAARFRSKFSGQSSRGRGVHRNRRPAPRPPRATVSAASESYRLDKNRDDLATILLRSLIYLFDLAYFAAIARPRLSQSHEVLVMDRYFYDSLANLVSARSFTVPYVRIFQRAVPHPDLAVLLLVAPETAFKRKPEYPLDYLKKREAAYREIFERVPNALQLDGMEDSNRIHFRLTRELDRLKEHRR